MKEEGLKAIPYLVFLILKKADGEFPKMIPTKYRYILDDLSPYVVVLGFYS